MWSAILRFHHDRTYQAHAGALPFDKSPWFFGATLKCSDKLCGYAPQRDEDCQSYAEIAMQIRGGEDHEQGDN